MSYEGYEQCICPAGHYWERPSAAEQDHMSPDDPDLRCDDCGADPVWVNEVDDTNLDDRGRVEVYTRLDGTCEIPPPTSYTL